MRVRKVMSVFLASMLFLMAACGNADGGTVVEESGEKEKYIPGSYTASETGFGGDVVVTITVDENSITSIEITGNKETETIGGKAIEELKAALLSNSADKVDIVSGATFTSNAVLKAYDECVAQAEGGKAEVAENTTMKAGTYKATAKGFYGDFEVTVKVSETNILSVEAGENMETPQLGGKAVEILSNEIVSYNTSGVDVVTGATLTSRAYISAVNDCLNQAGAPKTFKAAAEYPSGTVSKDADVVVVGAGAAGIAAAISAAESGAKVILIEKQGVVGGSCLISAGIVYAAMSEADVPVMEDYYQLRAENKADSSIVNFFAENSADTLKWLTERGVTWFMTIPSVTAPEPRANFATGFTGASIVEPLVERAEKAGVEIITNCKGTEILMKDGRVSGLLAEGKNISYTFNTEAVILATGGFDASEEMKAAYSPIAVGDFPLSNKGNTGDGINMGIKAGAATEFNGGIIGFVIVDGSLPVSGYSSIAMGAEVYVGSDGGYIIGNIDYPVTYTALKKSGYSSYFGLLDVDGEANGELAVSLGYGFKADTLEELAEASGMDVSKLKEAAEKSGTITTAPYYAVVVKPSTIGSMGGLKINTKAEVLDKNGTVIQGLYAAGETANAGLYYQEYPASGTSNAMSITFGIEAGKNAADYSVK